MADLNYLASTCDCSYLLDALKGKEIFDPVYHSTTMKEVREEMKKKKLATSDDILRKVESGMQKKEIPPSATLLCANNELLPLAEWKGT